MFCRKFSFIRCDNLAIADLVNWVFENLLCVEVLIGVELDNGSIMSADKQNRLQSRKRYSQMKNAIADFQDFVFTLEILALSCHPLPVQTVIVPHVHGFHDIDAPLIAGQRRLFTLRVLQILSIIKYV